MSSNHLQFDRGKSAASNRVSLRNGHSGLFRTGNRKATAGTTSQPRSESCIAVNPNNAQNLIGVSKKFTDPAAYLFKIGVIYTFDGGDTWTEADLPVDPAWDCLTDPWVAFDHLGNAFLVVEPDRFHPDKQHSVDSLDAFGMYVYRSQDGGRSWEQPKLLDADSRDDKQCVACDDNPQSPFYGNVYVVWGAFAPLKFARSTDHGESWQGQAGGQVGEIAHVDPTYAPELSISSDGTLHILWHVPGSAAIYYVRSTDGGNSFERPKRVVEGVHSLSGHLPTVGGFPQFPGANFRVLTMVTDCVSSGQVLLVAWADMREGHSRIYYRCSLDNGITWQGPSGGQPLLPDVSFGDSQCFHPQVAATPSGVIGCAFYTYGPEAEGRLIQVRLAASWDHGATFSELITVSDRPWDPLVNAPYSYGMSETRFIGDYFGLAACAEAFALLWTDTRTGVQELFFDRVVIRPQ